MAHAQGCIGIGPIEDPRGLVSALSEAVAAARAGKVCIVDVHVAAGYDPARPPALCKARLVNAFVPLPVPAGWKYSLQECRRE
jgi:hypothetical protein